MITYGNLPLLYPIFHLIVKKSHDPWGTAKFHVFEKALNINLLLELTAPGIEIAHIGLKKKVLKHI